MGESPLFYWYEAGMQIAGFTGCGESSFLCHSERSEESLLVLTLEPGEILRFAQNDIKD